VVRHRRPFTIEPGGHYYQVMAEAFLAGQLHLTGSPSPQLLALPDPYDPGLNSAYRFHDASLYDGRYYLYWGPAPGLIHAGWRLATGVPASTAALQVFAGVGGCLWFWLLLREIRDRALPRVSGSILNTDYLCYALGGVGLYLEVRPNVYHEAIVWATFFTLGSRATHIFYALGAGVVLLWEWLRAPRRPGQFERLVAYGGLPATAIALLFTYNYVRFGSILQTGQTYQLAGIGIEHQFDVEFIPYNLQEYLLGFPKWIAYYPINISPLGVSTNPVGWHIEGSLTSILLLAPLFLFVPCAPRVLGKGWRPSPIARSLIVAGGVGLVGTSMTPLTYFWASGRQAQDVLPLASLLGGVGLWSLVPLRDADTARRLTFAATCGALALISTSVGLTYPLVSFTQPDGYHLTVARDLDTTVAALVQHLAPSAWPTTCGADLWESSTRTASRSPFRSTAWPLEVTSRSNR
jgi:hypothetical protein